MLDMAGYIDRYFAEQKANTLIETGTGIPIEKFTAHEREKIRSIIEELWGIQVDNVTMKRVTESLARGDLPEGFLNDINGITEAWIRDKFLPTYTDAVNFAASGEGGLVGMMGSINKAVGADILFNPATDEVLRYIREEGADLAVFLTRGQHDSLKQILTESIKNKWSETQTYVKMRQGITLTPRETGWLLNYEVKQRKFWDKFYRDEFPGLSDSAISKKVDGTVSREVARQHRSYKNSRSSRIGRTEIVRAHQLGNEQAHIQALKSGIIKEALKKWVSQNRIDNWASTGLYNGKRIPINQDFSQFGKPAAKRTTMRHSRFPNEINERCTTVWYVRK